MYRYPTWSYQAVRVLGAIVATLLLLLLLAGAGMARADQGAPRDDTAKQNFDANWQFALVDQNDFTQATADPNGLYYNPTAGTGAPFLGYSTSFSGSQWGPVTLPQDWSVTLAPTNSAVGSNPRCASCNQATAWLPGGFAWYRKVFTVSGSPAPGVTSLGLAGKAGDVYSIDFGGSFGFTTVYLNGVQVGTRELSGFTHDYGFGGFRVNLPVGTGPGQLNPSGQNVLAVNVSNQPDSHFYKGSGLYGDVYFLETPPVHIARYGVFVQTPNLASTYNSASPHGDAQVQTQVVNQTGSPDPVTVSDTIFDAAGNQVASGQSAGPLAVPAGGSATDTTTLTVSNPKLWSPATPNLYSIHTTISDSSGALDSYVETFGFRWLNWDPNTGFSINGVPMKEIGADLHSSQGAMGEVQNYDSDARELTILKAGGLNTIRTSHNPPQWTFFSAAERLGFMVEDEFDDGWGKNAYAPQYFNPDSDADITDMVLAERNSPSVVNWSLGNEPSQASTSQGLAIIQRLAADVKAVDPTRAISFGPLDLSIPAQGSAGDLNLLALPTDELHYLDGTIWDALHEQYPQESFWEGEFANQNTTRGTYDACDQVSGASTNQIATPFAPTGETLPSSCDNSSGEGPNGFMNVALQMKVIRDRPFLAGAWQWTGFDYMGEATGSFPSKSSYFGTVDLAGFPKDPYYLVQSQWSKTPMVHIVPDDWTDYKPGQNVTVFAYSNQKNVDLKVVDPVTGNLITDYGTKSFAVKTEPWGATYLETNVARLDNANPAPVATTLRFAAAAGDKVVYPASFTGYNNHQQQVTIGADPSPGTGASETFTSVWGAASNIPSATTLAAASTAGATNIKVATTNGFHPGEQFKVDLGAGSTPGANTETATVTALGSAASAPSTLAAPVRPGDGTIYLDSMVNYLAGDHLTIDTGANQETTETVTRVGVAASAPTTTAAAAAVGDSTVKVASVSTFNYGDTLVIDATGANSANAEEAAVTSVGTAAANTTLFAAAASGATNIEVASTTGISVGDQLTIDPTSSPQSVTVTTVGTQGLATTLSAASLAGATNVKVASVTGLTAGDTITIDSGSSQEIATIAPGGVGTTGATGTGVTVTAPLTFAHSSGAALTDTGSGITFSPALANLHASGAAVNDTSNTGTGVTFTPPLARVHAAGAPIRDLGTGMSLSGATPIQQAHPAGVQVTNSLGTGITFTPALALAHASGAAILPAARAGPSDRHARPAGWRVRMPRARR